jgi:hypothetical protein
VGSSRIKMGASFKRTSQRKGVGVRRPMHTALPTSVA